MNTIDYVFPNIIHPGNRGGLAERWDLAKQHECRYIEMPAPFVHTKTEKDLTGQSYGELLTSDTISLLYTKGSNLPDDVEYILNTDPGFDTTGSGYTPKYLKWYDRMWVEAYARMLTDLAGHLGKVPHTIEIHPGSPKNTAADYVLAMNILRTVFEERTGQMPDIVLENLTVSHVHSGVQLAEIGELLEITNPDLGESCGFVVDISGIWTANRQKKEAYPVPFDAIPTGAVKGLHVHLKHQPLDEAEDPAFWACFREWMSSIDYPIFINPEIHTMGDFLELYPYCQGLAVKEV